MRSDIGTSSAHAPDRPDHAGPLLRDWRTRNAGAWQRRPGSVKGGVRFTPRLLSDDRRPHDDGRAGSEQAGNNQQPATI
jgi:hypothetical protein